MKNTIIIVLSWSLMISILSCSGSVYRQPIAAGLTKPEIATLFVDSCTDTKCLILVKIDDVRRGKKAYEIYELKPGMRQIEFTIAKAGKRSKKSIVLEFDPLPGAVYEARLLIDSDARGWDVEIYEKKSGDLASHPY